MACGGAIEAPQSRIDFIALFPNNKEASVTGGLFVWS